MEWKRIIDELPAYEGTDSENAYISKSFLLKFSNEHVSNIYIAAILIPWVGNAEIFYSSWSENLKITAENQEKFDNILWKNID